MITPDKFHRDLENIRELDKGTIQGTESLDEIGWDSFSAIVFIAFADSDYGVAIPADRLQKAKTVSDLLELANDPVNKRV